MSALHSLRTSAAAAIIVAIICGGAKSADAVTTTLVEPSTTGAGIAGKRTPTATTASFCPTIYVLAVPSSSCFPAPAPHPRRTMTSPFGQPS